MAKKMLLLLAGVVLVLLFTETAALWRLHRSLAGYAAFWQQLPQTGSFTYVVLGDSAAQGIGASRPELGYVGLIAKDIERATGKTVRIVNLSVSGAKIQDVINTQVPELKHYKPDLVTVEVGSNDIVHESLDLFQARYDALAATLPKGTIVANLPYFGGRVHKNTQAIAANQYIDAAAKRYGLHVVDLQTETRKRQSILNYASDLFHPSDRGYRNWERAFWQAIEPLVHS